MICGGNVGETSPWEMEPQHVYILDTEILDDIFQILILK